MKGGDEMKVLVYLILLVVAFAALLGLGTPSGEAPEQGQTEHTVKVRPGESIQAAIDSAPEGSVILISLGRYQPGSTSS